MARFIILLIGAFAAVIVGGMKRRMAGIDGAKGAKGGHPPICPIDSGILENGNISSPC